MKFTIDSLGAAKIFVRSIGGGDDDAQRLKDAIEYMVAQKVCETAETAKMEYRILHPGGCKVFSHGDDCECFLCKMDLLQTPWRRVLGE